MPCCQIQTGEQHLILSGVTVHLQVQQHTDRVRACVCGQYAGMRHQAVIGISGGLCDTYRCTLIPHFHRQHISIYPVEAGRIVQWLLNTADFDSFGKHLQGVHPFTRPDSKLHPRCLVDDGGQIQCLDIVQCTPFINFRNGHCRHGCLRIPVVGRKQVFSVTDIDKSL